MSARALLAVAVAGCWRDPATPASGAPAATLDDLGWLAGTWESPQLVSHWVRAGRALYGVAMSGATCEINTITDRSSDGKPAPITLSTVEWSWLQPNTVERMQFQLVSATATEIEFVDQRERAVRVVRTGRGWRGEFRQPGQDTIAIAMKPSTLHPPPLGLPPSPMVAPVVAGLTALGVVEQTVATASHNDVAFAIGTMKVVYRDRNGDGKIRSGSYWRVWHQDGEKWRLVTGASQLE
jgi:hypothetical protein